LYDRSRTEHDLRDPLFPTGRQPEGPEPCAGVFPQRPHVRERMAERIRRGPAAPGQAPWIYEKGKAVTESERPLEGKVAIVTGAGSTIGIGHAMTLALVAAGARVAMLDIDEYSLAQSADEARAIGGQACVVPIR